MEKELQRKYLQLQLMKQQMNALLEEKAVLDEKMSELAITINAMEKLKNVKKEQEIWSPLGSAAFVESGINDTDKVLIGIGAGVILKKKREEAMVIIQGRLDELNKIDKEIMTEINKFNDQVARLEPEVQKLAQQEQEKEQSKEEDE